MTLPLQCQTKIKENKIKKMQFSLNKLYFRIDYKQRRNVKTKDIKYHIQIKKL